MIMFARKVASVSHLRRIVNCEAIRTVRGKITIPIHLNEVKARQKKRHPSQYLSDVCESNVGVGHTLRSYLQDTGRDIDEEIDSEDLHQDYDLTDIEPAIHNLSSDLRSNESKKSFHTIKKKYFRPEKLPGMLTYAEKQQIIHLNEEDPDYWDAYKLAEGFPATPEIIKKVLKAKFVAHTVKQILSHDERVKENWKAFERGKLKFDDELQKIYSSFIGRSRFITDVKEMEKYIPPPPDFASQIPVKEFSSIISSSEKFQLEAEKQRKQVSIDEQGRFVYHTQFGKADIIDESEDTEKSTKHDTLETLRKKIGSKSKLRELDKVIVAGEPLKQIEQSPNVNKCVEEHGNTLVENKQHQRAFLAEENQHTLVERKEHHYDHMNATGVVSRDFNPLMVDKVIIRIPSRITIPRKLWQKDKLYRVRDCFYDDNGYFVYRVPGLEHWGTLSEN